MGWATETPAGMRRTTPWFQPARVSWASRSSSGSEPGRATRVSAAGSAMNVAERLEGDAGGADRGIEGERLDVIVGEGGEAGRSGLGRVRTARVEVDLA